MAEIILSAMEEKARRRLLSKFDKEANENMEEAVGNKEREGNCDENVSSENPKLELETSSDTKNRSVSVSDTEIECNVNESEYSSGEETDDSNCSSQISVIMRQAPKTAVLNWLRGIEVSQDSPFLVCSLN